jgi:hypothetical protein
MWRVESRRPCSGETWEVLLYNIPTREEAERIALEASCEEPERVFRTVPHAEVERAS